MHKKGTIKKENGHMHSLGILRVLVRVDFYTWKKGNSADFWEEGNDFISFGEISKES